MTPIIQLTLKLRYLRRTFVSGSHTAIPWISDPYTQCKGWFQASRTLGPPAALSKPCLPPLSPSPAPCRSSQTRAFGQEHLNSRDRQFYLLDTGWVFPNKSRTALALHDAAAEEGAQAVAQQDCSHHSWPWFSLISYGTGNSPATKEFSSLSDLITAAI